MNRLDNIFYEKVLDMFLYTTIYFCYFCNTAHKRHSERQNEYFFQRLAFSPVSACSTRKRYLLTCLITVLKDRLNLSLNDPICHHFKLSVRLYMSHNLEKKKRAKSSSKYSSYFIIIIQIYLLCQFLTSAKKL